MVKSILVVATPSAERSALVAHLEAAGHLLVLASSRAEALDILTRVEPGAIFIDLSLPGREGRQLLDHLGSRPRLRMVPRLVALGAWRRNTKPVKACAVFVKPLDLDHVVRTLRTVYPPPLASSAPAELRWRGRAWEFEIESALAS